MPVEIIAHRGASRDCLENTLEAFQRALEQGADAFELDVHATRDGVVVVHHDPDVAVVEEVDGTLRQADRQMSQAGHSGAAGGTSRKLVINEVDYTTLLGVRLRNGETIPTLDEVLTLAARRATVYVEVKGLGIEAKVIGCLLDHPDTNTAVHSFDHRIPHTIAAKKPGTATGILSASYVLDWPAMIRSAGARDLWQQTALIDQALVDVAHAEGARVVAWTENSVQHATQLVQMGVDAICTDTPGAMRAGLVAMGVLSI